MGNTLGGKKTTKVMKINGETFKLKTPIKTGEVLKDYPEGYVLLESESVKHYGTRAKPLEPHQELQPKRLYFLVELPKVKKEQVTRRVRSGINMSAKDRLENLMLARRSVSDLSVMKPTYIEHEEAKEDGGGGGLRVRMKLPKAEVERLMKESKDEEEAAEKIMELCLANSGNNNDGRSSSAQNNKVGGGDDHEGLGLDRHVHWNGGGGGSGHGRVRDQGVKVMF